MCSSLVCRSFNTRGSRICCFLVGLGQLLTTKTLGCKKNCAHQIKVPSARHLRIMSIVIQNIAFHSQIITLTFHIVLHHFIALLALELKQVEPCCGSSITRRVFAGWEMCDETLWAQLSAIYCTKSLAYSTRSFYQVSNYNTSFMYKSFRLHKTV